MRYVIKNQNGDILSTHSSLELAEQKLNRLKAWVCASCYKPKRGWATCGCNAGIVCSAEHYHTKIIEMVANQADRPIQGEQNA